jgi:predicted HicB family RNase H-like nuclease
MKSLLLRLEPELHKALKIEAANRDMSMTEIIRFLIVDELSKKGERA